jgi:hypothetical protein
MTTYVPFGGAKLSTDTEEALPVEPGLGELVGQGLRSGGYDTRGKLHKLAGTVMDANGLDGSEQNAASLRDRALSQAAGKDLVPLSDVKDIRSGLRYAAGTVGSVLPLAAATVGAGVLSGGRAVPALMAGTAVQAPVEVGGQLQRQDQDEANLFATPGERLRAAIPAGLGSAAVQNIIPAGVAARMTGHGAGATVGQIGLRAAADVPANAVASGGAELIRQRGDQQLNPNAAYDLEAAKEAGIEGGVAGGLFGAAGAAGSLAHKAKGAPGRAIDAVKGLVPDKAKEALGGAADQAGDVAEWMKGTIAQRTGDVKAWGKELLESDTVPEALRAQIEEAIANPGDKARQAWLATLKFGEDAKRKASTALDEADVPTRLGALHERIKAGAAGLMDKLADGKEVADPAKLDGVNDKKVLDEADQSAAEWAKQRGTELMKEHLGEETTAKIQTAMQDVTDKVNQQTIATIARAQNIAATTKASVAKFAEGFKRTETDSSSKKSEDYSGVRAKIGQAVIGVLGEDHPAFGNPRTINKLADGLRSYLEQVSSGKALDSFDKLVHLNALFDVTGDQTTSVLKAVHEAVGEPGGDKAAFFNTLNQIDAIQKGKQGVLETMQKNLRPELQDAVRPSELRAEAELLDKWAQSKSTRLSSKDEMSFTDAQVKAALEHRYGDKVDVVLAAVEKNLKHEENILDLAETTERIAADGVSSVRYYAQNKQLYLHPDLDKGSNGFEGAAAQRMKTAQRDNPGATVQFRRASEIGMDDKMVKAKHADLVDEGLTHGLSEWQAKARADKEIDKYGVVTAEQAKQETAINAGDLAAIKLDAKHFGKSPSRLDVDGHIVDAIKLTELMKERLGERNDFAAFKEGIAALTDRVGKAVDVPDSTVFGKSKQTWGEAKQRDVRTAADKEADAKTKELTDLRKAYKAAKSPAERAAITKRGKELAGEQEWKVISEQLSDEHDTRAPKVKENEDGVHEIKRREARPETEEGVETDLTGNVHEALKGGDNPLAEKAVAASNERFTGAKDRTTPAVLDKMLANEDYSRLKSKGQVAQFIEDARQRFAELKKLDSGDGDLTPEQVQAFGTLYKMFGKGSTFDFASLNPDFGAGEPPGPKAVAAKQAAFVEKARSGDPALLKSLSELSDAKGLQRAVEHIAGMKGEGFEKAIETINARLSELVQKPGVAYGLQTKTYSLEGTDPGVLHTGKVRAEVEAHLKDVLGPIVKTEWANIMHAGEFQPGMLTDTIRISVHALNPMSVAYHESLHGFFNQLRHLKLTEYTDVLEKAGGSAPVMNQLKRLLANEPDALKQLTNPEERAAYMYQFWAQGKLSLGPQTTNVFQRIANFIRSVTGLWTNDQHAEKILNYFHEGEFVPHRNDASAVSRALESSTTTHAVEKLKAMTEPFRRMGETLASAGGARLRDTGIPALRELADAMKLKTTSEGKDQGYLPAARAERSRVMNQIGTDLKPYGEAAIAEALEAMQNGTKAQSLAARTVATMVGKRLDETLKYMQDAGVRIEALGLTDGTKYFPRSWDASYISSHQRQFLAMLDKYVASGELKGDPRTIMQKLMVTDGGEFNVEVDKPGMQNAKQRVLSFIAHADAAPFMRKNLYEILNSYITQATRRAEWARRFGDDGAGVKDLIEKAKGQGATKEQIEAAQGFVRAVDGTLGDTINPTARRMIGNMIVYQNLRLLPLAIFSSAVDSQGILVRGGTVSDAFKTFSRGMKEVVKNFQKDAKSDKMTQLAETLGVVDSAMLVHTLGASYSQGMVGNKGRAINDTFFRFNLMEQYNTSMRVGATEAAMNFLVRHSTAPGEHSVRFLRELGLEAKDVQLDALGRPKLLERDGLTLEHAAKMKAAVNRWVDGAILRPDAVDKPIWMSDPHYALMAHLKQFVFSFHETILKRVAHEAKNGNYAPAMGLASYVPMMIAADLLKGLIQGGGQQPSWKDKWGAEDYVWSGMERAGLFGVGQFGIDALGDLQRGGSGLGALMGPTAEQLTEGLQVLGGREQFKTLAVKSLPANALYATALKAEASDPKFAD